MEMGWEIGNGNWDGNGICLEMGFKWDCNRNVDLAAPKMSTYVLSYGGRGVVKFLPLPVVYNLHSRKGWPAKVGQPMRRG
jgi:hypothetical protein